MKVRTHNVVPMSDYADPRKKRQQIQDDPATLGVQPWWGDLDRQGEVDSRHLNELVGYTTGNDLTTSKGDD
ncbi:hypothetical protein [Brevibacterium senegalense]|uniref:hypothetical protein n=1 Tax=Brevibacterium senegalense TaxID=1033736 RepID=UPI0011C834E1|nr:hypothetical protein [Brevibacterium senegalense]